MAALREGFQTARDRHGLQHQKCRWQRPSVLGYLAPIMAGIKSSPGKETLLLRGARVLSGGADLGCPAIFISRGRIVAIGPEATKQAKGSGCSRLGLSGYTLTPGFVDLHTHGAAGVDFVEATAAEFEFAMQHYLAHGVTSLLVSLYPTSWAKSLKVCLQNIF